MECELKLKEMKEEKVNVIIVTFADYVENYYGEENNSDDVPGIVDDYFDEFIEWASDDLLIDEEDQEILEGNPDPAFRNCIKKEVIQEFKMILGVRKFKSDPANADSFAKD